MLITKDERIKKRLCVNELRNIGLNFRLIDSYSHITEVLAYATTREELFDMVESESIKRGIEKCDLITQEWCIDKNMYSKNYYHTKERTMFIYEDGKRKFVQIRQLY